MDDTEDSFSGLSIQLTTNHRGYERAGETVWYGSSPRDVPKLELSPIDTRVFASFSGPDRGLLAGNADSESNSRSSRLCSKKDSLLLHLKDHSSSSLRRNWKQGHQKAWGHTVSLYDRNPMTKQMTGDPVADAFAVVARNNSGLVVVADGVNWGASSRLAARAALFGCVRHVDSYLEQTDSVTDTRKALAVLLEGFVAAHAAILRADGGLTTLTAALALPLRGAQPQFAVACVNVGDSLAFLWSKVRGVREITVGSHDVSSARDVRNACGALGPALAGKDPQLNNLTCSLTVCDPGDILFVTSDGVSDNFDAVVQRLAETWPPKQQQQQQQQQQLHLQPSERHQYMLKQMEAVLLQQELSQASPPSAKQLCHSLIAFADEGTSIKRQLLEDPRLRLRDSCVDKRTRRPPDAATLKLMRAAAGKLDHATVAAYEVGEFRGVPAEIYEETAQFLPVCAGGAGGANGANGERGSDSGCSDCDTRRLGSCDSFAPDFLSDIEFADSDSSDSCCIE